jgi:hypothetical protein
VASLAAQGQAVQLHRSWKLPSPLLLPLPPLPPLQPQCLPAFPPPWMYRAKLQ